MPLATFTRLATPVRRGGARPPGAAAPVSLATCPSAVARASLVALALAPAAFAAPLDDGERARADALARAVPWVERDTTPRAAARAGTTGVDAAPRAAPHVLGVQTLAVEEASGKRAPSGERVARVYQHDHGTRRTRRVLVDLVGGAALETRPLDSPHLPLNDAERRWALARLAAESPLLATLREEQRRRGTTPFATLDELDVKASVFEPTDPAHACARERCALLSLFDASRTVFAVEPIVRFADGAVTTLTDARPAR